MMMAGCCCGCSCACLPSTVSVSHAAFTYYFRWCACVDPRLSPYGFNSGPISIAVPALSNATGYACCSTDAGYPTSAYRTTPVFLGTVNAPIDITDPYGEACCTLNVWYDIIILAACEDGSSATRNWELSVRIYADGFTDWDAFGMLNSCINGTLTFPTDPCSLPSTTGCLTGYVQGQPCASNPGAGIDSFSSNGFSPLQFCAGPSRTYTVEMSSAPISHCGNPSTFTSLSVVVA
jgi:hypothetical protein